MDTSWGHLLGLRKLDIGDSGLLIFCWKTDTVNALDCQVSMKLKFILVLGLILAAIAGYIMWRFGPRFYLADNRSLETTITKKISPSEKQNIERESDLVQVNDDHLYGYNGKTVRRTAGKFLKLSGPETLATLTIEINGKESVFILDKNTATVCQPSGFLNISGDEQVPANNVFIDDKRMDNTGVPWGIQFPLSELGWRVKTQSYTQVFYLNESKLINIPSVVYVWFKDCG
ncbi:MAG: hypothetical protein HY602_01315 [Parcubacteria group bacterium]|nr:hypothetical protein [Parcubacteria group bacterium]